MIIFLVLKFFSCQTAPFPHDNKNLSDAVTLFITGEISPSLAESCYREINRERTEKILAKSEQDSEYLLYVGRRNTGYVVKLWQGKTLLQNAWVISTYEIPLAASAVVRQQFREN